MTYDQDVQVVVPTIERALCGAVMVIGSVPDGARLPPETFSAEATRTIWEAILAVSGDGPFDCLAVVHHLAQNHRLDRAGGWAAVTLCLDDQCADLVNQYARILRDEARIRRARRAKR
jgi:replicative DNA helicase